MRVGCPPVMRPRDDVKALQRTVVIEGSGAGDDRVAVKRLHTRGAGEVQRLGRRDIARPSRLRTHVDQQRAAVDADHRDIP